MLEYDLYISTRGEGFIYPLSQDLGYETFRAKIVGGTEEAVAYKIGCIVDSIQSKGCSPEMSDLLDSLFADVHDGFFAFEESTYGAEIKLNQVVLVEYDATL